MRVMAVLALATAVCGCAATPAAFRATPIEVVRVERPAQTEQEKLADFWRQSRATAARAQQFAKPFVEPSNPTQRPESEDQRRRDEEGPDRDAALALRTVAPK